MEGLLEEFSDPQEEDKPQTPHRSSAGPSSAPNGNPPAASPESQQNPKTKNLGNLRAITDDELREIGVPMPN